jgi:hypothetical protein
MDIPNFERTSVLEIDLKLYYSCLHQNSTSFVKEKLRDFVAKKT